jgi:CRISPR-associated endonuclease Cas2
MLVVVYDIVDKKRLQKVAKFFESRGVRTQRSVFELDMKFSEGKKLLEELSRLIEDNDKCFLYDVKKREDLAMNTAFEEIL